MCGDYTLLNNLHEFKKLNYPILVGASRKSMIYKLLNISPEKALNGTSIINTVALKNGADSIQVFSDLNLLKDTAKKWDINKFVKKNRLELLNFLCKTYENFIDFQLIKDINE